MKNKFTKILKIIFILISVIFIGYLLILLGILILDKINNKENCVTLNDGTINCIDKRLIEEGKPE